MAQDAGDSTAVSTSQQLNQDVIQELFQDSQRKAVAQEQTTPTHLDSLPSSANQHLSTVSLSVTTASTCNSDYGLAALSRCSAAVSQQTSAASSSQVPLFIASHDLLSLPVITLPLVACSIASSGGIATLNESISSEKSYVTVAAMAMDDISTLPENAVFKPTDRTL